MTFPVWAIVVAIITPIAFFAFMIFIGKCCNKVLSVTPVADIVRYGAARRMEEGVWRPSDSLENLGPDMERPKTPPPVYLRASPDVVVVESDIQRSPTQDEARDPSPSYERHA